MPSPTDTMNEMTRTFSKACEDANAIVANYVSAATKSNAAAWQGIEDLTRNMGALVQETLTRTVNVCTTMAAARSPQEAVETHADFMRDSFDQAVANGSKLSEISMRTAQSALDPLAQHANSAMGSIMKKAKVAA